MNKNLNTSNTEYSSIDSNIRIYTFTDHTTKKFYIIYFKLKEIRFDNQETYDKGLVLFSFVDQHLSLHHYIGDIKFGDIKYFSISNVATL